MKTTKTTSIDWDYKNLNIKIVDSYQIKKSKEIKQVLQRLRATLSFVEMVELGYKRTLDSMLREWKAHNLLYSLGIKREQTKDADLNAGESLIRRIGYFILSLFYWK